MIRGQVTPSHEAVIRIEVFGSSRLSRVVETIIDTGFCGFLSLPMRIVEFLQLSFREIETYTLADNTDVELPVFTGRVLWDGRVRPVFVVAAEGDALVGMSLIRGYRLTVDTLDGGPVTIQALPLSDNGTGSR